MPQLFENGDDISGVDLVLDVEQLSKLHKFIHKGNYMRLFNYLLSYIDYSSDDGEYQKILDCLLHMAQ